MRRRAAGFTLLEVMIAMTILAGALTWIVVGMARNIQAENHAKLMTTATFLARYKMNDLEDDLYEKGFSEFEKELSGTFEDKGFQRFSWKVVVDKVEMPSVDQVQTMMGKAGEAKNAVAGNAPGTTPSPTTDPSQSPVTSSIGMMSSLYPIIKDVLEGGIRRLNVQVLWTEGSHTYDVGVMAYYTDPRRVDQAVNLSGLAALGGSGTTTGSNTTGSSSTSTTSSTKTTGTTK